MSAKLKNPPVTPGLSPDGGEGMKGCPCGGRLTSSNPVCAECRSAARRHKRPEVQDAYWTACATNNWQGDAGVCGDAEGGAMKSRIRYKAARRATWRWFCVVALNVLTLALAVVWGLEVLAWITMGISFPSIVFFARAWLLSEWAFWEVVDEERRLRLDVRDLLK